MKVIKRDGRHESVSFDKITTRISKLSNGLDRVDPVLITQKVVSQIYNEVKTSQIDELAAEISYNMSTLNPQYEKLAARIAISNNHKNTSPSFSETIQILYDNRDVNGKSTPLIADDVYKIIMKNKEKINSSIDYEKDYNFDYFGFKTLEKAYLLKMNGITVERISHMFMRASIGINKEDINGAIETYNLMINKYFVHATPTLYHSGMPYPQLSSCFLMGIEDSVEGIYKALSDSALISKWAGGIGIHISNIRSKGSRIRKTNGQSDGIIPMLRNFNETARYINQSGKRKGSFAIYLEPHHPDILDFLDLKKNTGAQEMRTKDLFLAVWLSDLFMECVEKNEKWYLFDPDECPGLNDVYGEEYRKLYQKYINESKYRKIIYARDIWNKIIESQIESGVPYIGFKDAVNSKSNQKNIGIIRSSNLCIEIVEYSDNKEYATCNLANLCLPKFLEDGKFNHNLFHKCIRRLVFNLNRVIDYNYYPVPETKLSNMRHRPIAIGIQGFADLLFKLKYNFDSDEAKKINEEIAESLYYGALKASMEISKIEGPYETFKGSPASEGILQFDLWNKKPSDKWNWTELKNNIKKYGLRNSLLIALMPTATTSNIMGNNECFEPITSNIYVRNTISGDFIIINKHLVSDLERLGLWNEEMKNLIILNSGSIQEIMEIPEDIKKLYRTVWELPQKSIIDLAIGRGPYICQTQSMNLFFSDDDPSKISSAIFYGWKNGLKTGSYYTRIKVEASAQQFTVDPRLKKRKLEVEMATDVKKLCSLNNRESCQSCQ